MLAPFKHLGTTNLKLTTKSDPDGKSKIEDSHES